MPRAPINSLKGIPDLVTGVYLKAGEYWSGASGEPVPPPPVAANQRWADAMLYELDIQQGFVAPLYGTEDLFVGTTYNPTTNALEIFKDVGGIRTILGTVSISSFEPAQRIGGVVVEGNYYITMGHKIISGPHTIC